MTANKKSLFFIIICIIVLILIILIGVIIPQCLKAGGEVNQKQISVVDSINSEEEIIIPVKMKKGYSTPGYQAFNSTLPIKKLCELAAEYNESIKYEIYDKNAYLYSEKSGKIVARAVLHKNSGEGYLNYVLENMNIQDIIFPTHLTEKYFLESIVLNGVKYNWYAVSFMSIDTLFDWLKNIGIYKLEMNIEKNTIICNYINNGKQFEREIYFEGNLIAIK